MIKEKYDNKTIFMMSLPIFVELLLQLLVGNIDQFMISKYSQEAVAAIGNGNQIMNIVIVVLNVMSPFKNKPLAFLSSVISAKP